MTNSVPEYLRNRNLRLIFFGGKGGTGKTTMAASAALYLARINPDKKILLISTDPAHSLSDSFGIEVGDCETVVPCGNNNLYACELETKRLIGAFKKNNEAVIKKLAERGTYFAKQDIAALFDLSLPGIDEVMAVIEIARLIRERPGDILLIDTAPSGHTIRMLKLPKQMQKWIEVMSLMQKKHRFLSTHYSGKKYGKDSCDIFLDKLSADLKSVKQLLADGRLTRFVPVTIPEPMSIYETERIIGALRKISIPVNDIIINRVMESAGCEFCRQKKINQQELLTEIEDKFAQYNLKRVPLFPVEIRGIDALRQLADYFSGERTSAKISNEIASDTSPPARLKLNPDDNFILFGGKGGVGKTTLAAAAALFTAKKYPEKRVLIFSTDPAHSLSDSFKLAIGDKITPVCYNAKAAGQKSDSHSTNLYALEINADQLFEQFKRNFKAETEATLDKLFGSGVDVKFDREVMTELLELAPPGLDEIMALSVMMSLKQENKFDIFILDTAPTGHLLRFLELPEKIKEWLKVFLGLLFKYGAGIKIAKIVEKTLAMSRSVRQIQETLTDTNRTEFIGVTIPEALSVLEMNRLIITLRKLGIPCEQIAVNMVVQPADCSFCSTKRIEQLKYIQEICAAFPSGFVTPITQYSHELSGIADLTRIGDEVFL